MMGNTLASSAVIMLVCLAGCLTGPANDVDDDDDGGGGGWDLGSDGGSSDSGSSDGGGTDGGGTDGGGTDGGGTDGGGTDGGGTDGGGTDGGGTDGGASAGLDYSDTVLVFPATEVGATSTQNVLVVNDSGDSVVVESIASSHASFTTSGLTPPNKLVDGYSRTMQVHFSPVDARYYDETITVFTDAGDQVITVAGTGEAATVLGPVISVDTGGGSSTSMEFFSALGIPDTQTVRVSNVGDEDLLVESVEVDNDDVFGTFQVVGWSGSETLAPGDSTSFSVKYTCPDLLCLDVPNPKTGVNILYISSNDPDDPVWAIELHGG